MTAGFSGMMPSLCFIALAFSAVTTAYPMYTPKRLRTYSPLTFPIYNARASRQYYYDPYNQDMPELMDIYSQDPYDRYRYYQVPYYLQVPEATPYYYDEEEIPEELEEEKIEEPYNQEWYNQDGNAKANAYFLQNLILADMYKDAASRFPVPYGYSREDPEQYVYGEPVTEAKDDDDVSQLKSLVTKGSLKRQQAKNKVEKSNFEDNTWTEKRAEKGQDEVVMPRPAIQRQVTFHQRVHEPSAYDAIKKLLQVQSQEKVRESESRQPQKRSYIPNEDALVEQLGNLKKSA